MEKFIKYLLTLLLNDRAELCSKALFISSVTVISSLSAAAKERQDVQPVRKQDLTWAASMIISALKNRPEMQAGRPLVVEPRESFRWSSTREDKRLLASVNVHFSGLRSSYCRLVAIQSKQLRAEVVPLPQSATYDACIKISRVLYVDLNGDGVLDVIQALDVKSNRYYATVDIPVVYLSSDGSKSGYCYSEWASEHLPPVYLWTTASVQQKLLDEMKRMSVSKLECSTK
jgi:hypothetical protein